MPLSEVERKELRNLIFSKVQSEAEEELVPETISSDFETRLKQVAKKWGLALKNNILTLIYEHNNTNYDIPLLAKNSDPIDITDELVLEGVAKNNWHYEPCLKLKLRNNSMELSWLGVSNAACPIPSPGSGNFLLGVVDKIAQLFEVDSIGLYDASTVRCEKDTASINKLALLSTFRKGMSWYGTHGYYSKAGKESDQRDGKKLREYSLVNIETGLNNMGQEIALEGLAKVKANFLASKNRVYSDYDINRISNYFASFLINKDIFEQKLRDYRSQQAGNSPESNWLGPFFTWLWEKDCAAYGKMVGFLFPEQGFGDLELAWNTLLPKATWLYKKSGP